MATKFSFEDLRPSQTAEQREHSSPLFHDPIMYATGAVIGADLDDSPNKPEATGNAKFTLQGHHRSLSTPDPIALHSQELTRTMTNPANPAAAVTAAALPYPTKDDPKPKRRYPKPQTPPMSRSARLRESEEFSPDNDMVWREALRRQQQSALERHHNVSGAERSGNGFNSNGGGYASPRSVADRRSIREETSDGSFRADQARISEHGAATQAIHRTMSRHSNQSAATRGKEWAPARSPLQKLEGKLNDISKEEKRARIEEAILLFNETQRNQETGSLKEDVLQTKAGSLRKMELPSRSSSYRDHRTSQRRPVSQVNVIPEDIGLSQQQQRPTFARRYSGGVTSIHDEISKGIARDLGLGSVIDHGERDFLGGKREHDTHSLYSEQRSGMDAISLPQRSATQHVSTGQHAAPQPLQPPPPSQKQGPPRLHLITQIQNREQFLLDPGMPSDDEHSLLSSGIDRRSTASPWRQHQRQIHSSRRPLPEPPHPGEHRVKSPYGIPTSPATDLQGKSDNSSSSRTFTEAGANNLRVPSQDTFESQHSSRKGKQKFKVSFPDLPPPTPTPLQEWRHAAVGRLRVSDLNLEGSDRLYNGGSVRSTRSRRSERVRAPLLNMPKHPPKRSTPCNPALCIECGPMLKFNGIKEETFDGVNGPELKEVWRGSMMIVTRDSLSTYMPAPVMRIFSQPMDLLDPPPTEVHSELPPEYIDPVAGTWKLSTDGSLVYVKPIDHLPEGKDLSEVEGEDGLFESTPSQIDNAFGQPYPSSQPIFNRIQERDGEFLGKYKDIVGIRLYIDPVRDMTFWRFSLEIELGLKPERIAYRINGCSALAFWVPAKGQQMHTMFHSGNGFALNVDRDKLNGPDPLWRDVLNNHQTTPFNVMIGGGDQIYNDSAMFETSHFSNWMSLRCSPEQMAHPFNNDIRNELEEFFLYNYMRCFALGLFSVAVAQIPMVNMWNDHDITSGFGSYNHAFMKTHIFAGFGTMAFKYYLLFQHQCVIEETPANEPSWILGAYPGQYIKEKSRNVFVNLGGGVRLLALDCRTERSRDDVLSDTTYQRIWNRVHNELARDSIRHLLVVSGLPVAYPRLVWLQKFLTSKVADGVQTIFGKFSDRFEVDMSMLDSQWTSRTHKQERSWLVEDLQEFAACKSARVTILSGDVRMAAVGRFYSNPELQIAKENDYRYMLNIVSSSIADEPTGHIMADALNQRNKVHEFDLRTKEDLCPAFSQDVDGKPRTNKKLFPRRNWCSIKQWQPDPPRTESPSPERNGRRGRGRTKRSGSISRVSASVGRLARRLSRGPPADRGSSPSSQTKRMSQDSLPMTIQRSSSLLSRNQSEETIRARGRSSVLSRHRVGNSKEFTGGWADVHNPATMEGGLDITIHCECNPRDPAGITTPYRILVPTLDYDGPFEPSVHREKKKGWWKIKRGQGQDGKKGQEGEGDGNEEDDDDDDDLDEDVIQRTLQNARPPDSSDSDEDERDGYNHGDDNGVDEDSTELAQQVSRTSSMQRPSSQASSFAIPPEHVPNAGLAVDPHLVAAKKATTAAPAMNYDGPTEIALHQVAALAVTGAAAGSGPGPGPGGTDKTVSDGDSLSRMSSASQTPQGSLNAVNAVNGLTRGDGTAKRRKKFLGVF